MNISTRGRYGLRALLGMAIESKKGPVTIRDISEKQRISITYLEQIFHKLKKAGVLKSVRGAKGGYILAKENNQITVREIIDILDGPISTSYCDFPQLREKSCVGPTTCVPRILWKELDNKIAKILSGVTLADLEKKAKILAEKINRRKV